MTMLPKVVHELCADEPAAANHDDLHMFIHIAGAERFAFHNGSSIRQVVIFVSHRLGSESPSAVAEARILAADRRQTRRCFGHANRRTGDRPPSRCSDGSRPRPLMPPPTTTGT